MITLADIQATGIDLASRNDAAIAAALSVGRVRIEKRLIGIGTVLDALGPEAGAEVVDRIEALAVASKPVKWGFFLLQRDNLDVALPSVRAQFDELAAAGVMTQAQADTLKALGQVADPVPVNDVSDILNAAGY